MPTGMPTQYSLAMGTHEDIWKFLNAKWYFQRFFLSQMKNFKTSQKQGQRQVIWQVYALYFWNAWHKEIGLENFFSGRTLWHDADGYHGVVVNHYFNPVLYIIAFTVSHFLQSEKGSCWLKEGAFVIENPLHPPCWQAKNFQLKLQQSSMRFYLRFCCTWKFQERPNNPQAIYK